MANIRDLKKEIDTQLFAVISDSLAAAELKGGIVSDDLYEVINGAVDLRNELIKRANNPAADESGSVKKSIQQINADLKEGTEKLFLKLSSLSKKKSK